MIAIYSSINIFKKNPKITKKRIVSFQKKRVKRQLELEKEINAYWAKYEKKQAKIAAKLRKWSLNYTKYPDKSRFYNYERNVRKVRGYLQGLKNYPRNIGFCFYNTINNYYLVIVDLEMNPRKVLYLVSSGMVKSYKRCQRKRYKSVELCARKISFFLSNNNLNFINVFIYSSFRRKFFKSCFKGLRYNYEDIFFKKFYDYRRYAHNGCLGMKLRRV